MAMRPRGATIRQPLDRRDGAAGDRRAVQRRPAAEDAREHLAARGVEDRAATGAVRHRQRDGEVVLF